jgi:hypothetical protein
LDFTQTLTTLYLYSNQIGDKGVQYLSEALQKNSVKQNNQFIHFYHIFIFCGFHSDTHNTLAQKESNQ